MVKPSPLGRLSTWLLCAAAVAIAAPAQAQKKSVNPGINKSFQDPDVEKYVERFEREGREVYENRDEIIAACNLTAGMAVADVGAGTGFFSRLIARKVGPDGRVYAVDIAQNFVDHVEKTSREAGLENVVGVVCKQDDVNLPPASIDLAFVCDTYHHFEFPHKTLRSIYRALRPGGKLVVIDFKRIEGASSEWILGHVRAGQETFTNEILDSGFRLVGEKKELLKDNYFLRFEKVPPQARAASRPNVLLIVSEDNGPELSCYGDDNVSTPNIDRLAAEGVRFEHAFVTHPVCSCSRSSILTGLYPHQNGQIGLATHKYALFEDFPNIPSLLKQDGYRTGIIGKLHVNPESAFDFDFRWNDRRYISFGNRDVRKIAQVADDFITADESPFFLMVNYPDAHFPLLRQQQGIPENPLSAEDVEPLPFIGVDSARLRKGAADYYNCMRRLDTGIGLLLERLAKSGRDENTLVIYLGDHGAQFSRGKATCFEGGLRIPLILHWPGRLQAGTVRTELASTIDLLPTILEAVGHQGEVELPGRSLLPLTRGEDVPWREYLFAERTAYSASTFFPQRTVRDGRYKMIVNLLPDRPNPVYDNYLHQRGSFFMYGTNEEELTAADPAVRRAYATWHQPPRVELYELEKDPHEFVNLAGRPELENVQRQLAEALHDWQQRTGDALADPEKLQRLTAEHARVHEKYPDQGYRREPGFRWQYLDYLAPSQAQAPSEK